MSFRDYPREEKEAVTFLLPRAVDQALREFVARRDPDVRKRSLSEVITEACCQYLQIDPKRFGIDDEAPVNTPVAVADSPCLPV